MNYTKIYNIPINEDFYEVEYQNGEPIMIYTKNYEKLIYKYSGMDYISFNINKELKEISNNIMLNYGRFDSYYKIDNENQYFLVENGALYNNNKTKLIDIPNKIDMNFGEIFGAF